MSDRGRGRGRSGGRGGGGGRGPTPSGGRGPTPSGGRGPTPSGGPSVSGGRGYGGPTSSGGPSVSGGRGYGGPIPSAGPSPSGGRGYGGPPSGSRGYAGPPSGGRGYAGPPTSGDRGYGSPSTPPVSALGPELEKLSLSSSSTAVALPATATPQPMQQTAPATVQQPPQPPPSSSKAIRIPARPGYGSSGRRCLVRANHFLVKVADTLDIHHYDVTISPEVLSKKVCRDVVQKLVDDFKQTHMDGRTLAYDGRKSVYTAGPLPFSSKEFAIKLADDKGGARRDREFKVSIKFAAKADLSHLKQFLQCKVSDCPHETIQALDVALRAPPSAKYTVVGRSFFATTLGEIGSLGEGLEYWRGYYQSLRPTQMGLSLNIDMSARPFYEPICVVDYVAQYLNLRDPRNLNRSPMSDRDRNKVRRVLKGVRVQIDYRGIRRYKISGLSVQPIKELTFVDDTGGRTSVVEYFRQKYNITLRFPMLPAIQAGNDAKPVYLPMELCTIVSGQRYTKMLSGRQVSEMLKATCQRPSGREGVIKQIVNSNQYHVDLLMKEFGIEVQTELATVEARVLAPPGIRFGGSRMDPRVGQWNMIDKKMVNGGKVDTWTCVNFSRSDESEFIYKLIEMCCNKGMEFNPQPLVDFRSAHPGNIERTLAEIHAECAHKLKSTELKHLQLLIIILPEASGSYGTIKRICETDLGIVSQCCQPKNVSRPNMQYLENVALKINVKAGGRNSVLEMAVQRRIPFLTDMPTIVFGADVTHPQPGEDSSPSIASVVASMDWPEVSKYRGLVSAQTHRREIIADLYTKHEDPKKGIVHGGMIKELLVAFFKSTKLKPARLIFYRDGVSEGQFNQVLLEEMDAIRQACAALEPGYMPRVTFVVVQKRHHTRLFPANHNDRNLTDKSGNILPGTVVDTKICHPWEFDFYLCSHAGIKGTSRPTHYHVLYDENGFTADAIQNLTNQLCYTYARCTRSVSIVPPAYYAHLAAFRARYYMEGDTTDTGSSSGGGGNTTRDRTAVVRPLPIIKDNVKEVMFYC